MDYQDAVKYESSYFFVCLLTGILVSIEIHIFFYINSIELGLAANSIFLIPFEIIVLIISYIVGMFIHGIRYYFFDYYMKVYTEYKKEQEKKQQEEKLQTKKQHNEKRRKEKQQEKRPMRMRLLFYLFREDTTIEVLLSMKRNDNLDNYKWIRNSRNPANNLWPLAIKVSKEVDRSVYKFLFYSEFFQCFETTFIISSFLALLYNIYVIALLPINILSLIFNGIFLIVIFILHKASRNVSIVFAKRFFLDIDSRLKYLHYKNKNKKVAAQTGL